MLVNKEGRYILFECDQDGFAKFDLKNKVMYRKTDKKDWYEVKNANLFFRDMEVSNLKFKDKKFGLFIHVLKKIFMAREWNKHKRFTNISSLFTIAFPIYEYLQSYTNEKLKFSAEWVIQSDYMCSSQFYRGIKHSLNDYDKHIILLFKKYNLKFVPSFENRYFNDDNNNKNIYITLAKYILDSKKRVKVTDREYILKHIFDSYYDNEKFLRLVNNYNYNIGDLYDYLVKNADNGVIGTLQDYNNMMKNKLHIIKYNKYPKKLQEAHDLAVKNYNAIKDIEKNAIWEERVISKINPNSFEFKDKDYCVIYPRNATDIADEACQQNNCVKSYIDNVIERTCDIVFLRKVIEPEKSLITMEVRNNKVVQKEGKGRRKLNKKELVFLDKYHKYLNKA